MKPEAECLRPSLWLPVNRTTALFVGGLLFPVGDVGALEAALNRLVSDPPYRARLGAEARRRVLAEFTPSRVDSQYANLYATLLRTSS